MFRRSSSNEVFLGHWQRALAEHTYSSSYATLGLVTFLRSLEGLNKKANPPRGQSIWQPSFRLCGWAIEVALAWAALIVAPAKHTVN